MNHLLDLLQYYGLAFVFVNVLALQAGLPVPAYPTLIVTGALASRGGYSMPALLATAVGASLIADLALVCGRAAHRRQACCRRSAAFRCRPIRACGRPSRSSRAGARASLMVAKFVPGFASVATSMAGVVRLPLWRFIPSDAIGAALWSGVAIALGYIFRDAINEVLAVLSAGQDRPRRDRRWRSSRTCCGNGGSASSSSGSCAWTASRWTSCTS